MNPQMLQAIRAMSARRGQGQPGGWRAPVVGLPQSPMGQPMPVSRPMPQPGRPAMPMEPMPHGGWTGNGPMPGPGLPGNADMGMQASQPGGETPMSLEQLLKLAQLARAKMGMG